MSLIISGKEVAKFYRKNIKEEAAKLSERFGRRPGIACVLVGEDQASQIYVNNKEKTSNKLGLYSNIIRLPDNTEEDRLLALIEELNNDNKIDGILVQLPLPKHIDENKVIKKIKPEKDVDVFHPENIGSLWSGHGKLFPCTPLGIMKMLNYYKFPIEGKRVVIVGRSNIVGKPLAGLFLKAHGTVTICHSRTKNLDKVCKEADILVGAIGKAKFITKDFVKEGAVLIDVGMNRSPDGKLCGDMDFEELEKIASAITPVPGGVGPMTIAMLMYNTLFLYKEHNKC